MSYYAWCLPSIIRMIFSHDPGLTSWNPNQSIWAWNSRDFLYFIEETRRIKTQWWRSGWQCHFSRRTNFCHEYLTSIRTVLHKVTCQLNLGRKMWGQTRPFLWMTTIRDWHHTPILRFDFRYRMGKLFNIRLTAKKNTQDEQFDHCTADRKKIQEPLIVICVPQKVSSTWRCPTSIVEYPQLSVCIITEPTIQVQHTRK